MYLKTGMDASKLKNSLVSIKFAKETNKIERRNEKMPNGDGVHADKIVVLKSKCLNALYEKRIHFYHSNKRYF